MSRPPGTQFELIDPEHGIGKQYSSLIQPHLRYEYHRDWLRSCDASYPQLGEFYVYFPQGHIQHLLEFGDPETPFTAVSLCLCQIDSMEVRFPHHTCCSMSILLRLSLKIVGFPAGRSNTQHPNPVQSFVKLPEGVEFPRIVVTLRNCDLPDFLVRFPVFHALMGKPWKVGDPFEMRFVEKFPFSPFSRRRGVATRFGGKILRLREDAKWPGSPWEAADIQWDGSGGLQSISMFETCSDETPAASLPRAEQSRFLSVLGELEKQEWAGEFIEPVPSHLPELRCYDALVPVRMEFQCVRSRLEKGFYRTSEQVVWDLRLITANCLLFNDADSLLARHARLLEDAVRRIPLPPRESMDLPAIEPQIEVQPAVLEAISRLNEVWSQCGESVSAELPRFWVEHGAELCVRAKCVRRREQCVHPLLWRDVEMKANSGMYGSLSELGIDCLLVVQTLRAFHPQVKEKLPDLEQRVISVVEEIAARRNLELDL